VNDDSKEISSRGRYFRYAVFSLTALLVLSLGIALIPHEPAPPAKPPFSEQARAAAFADTVALRSASLDLARAAAAEAGTGGPGPLERIVTLLTIQAKALTLPDDSPSARATTGPVDGPTASTTKSPSAPAVWSAAELATALSASGASRLIDAAEADGGVARLLAATGTAQLLAAEELAAFAGIPAEALPAASFTAGSITAGSLATAVTAPGPSEPSPVGSAPITTQAPAGCATAVPSREGVGLDAALAAAIDAELETVYGYQAALTRLDPASVAPASALLAEHLGQADEAESYARIHCATTPPKQPGYVLSPGFLDAPAAGLGRLEAGTLPVYGDVVALSSGPTRHWAVSALLEAARRTLHWGGDPGPVPGLALNASQLPQLPGLPGGSPTAAARATPQGTTP
jgi:hypothetical protein